MHKHSHIFSCMIGASSYKDWLPSCYWHLAEDIPEHETNNLVVPQVEDHALAVVLSFLNYRVKLLKG